MPCLGSEPDTSQEHAQKKTFYRCNDLLYDNGRTERHLKSIYFMNGRKFCVTIHKKI